MRNLVLALTCLALTAGVVATQPPQPLQPQPAGPWAQKIFYGVSSHDFGSVPRGAQLKYRLKMKNIYAVPLVINKQDIRTTCGCVSWTPERLTLQPQEEAYLDINMDARRFTGPKTVTLYVTVGPQFVSTAAIVFSANARADVVFNPGSVDFGIVRAGQTPTQLIDVEYAGTLDWRILEVIKSAESPFTVAPHEMYREPPRLFNRTGKVGYRIDVTLKPNVPAGPFRQELMLRTNDPGAPVLTVEVEGIIQASLSVAPSLVRLGTIKVGKSASQKVAVRGSRPFRITGIDGEGDGLSVTLPAAAAESHLLTIQYQPQKAGEFRRELSIRTDLDDGAATTVTVEATAEP